MGTRERMAIAAHLHVLLRRHLGRVSDVEWMARNREYAESLAGLAKASGQGELCEWAARLIHAFENDSGPPSEPVRSVPPGSAPAEPQPAPKYVRGLR